ncbi:MAG TPA: NlpC/P60 family protein [Nocardioidaceae bacterium]|nr:NlpC/P60 family protein [Nocardioidaceae bacterium]
MTDYAIAAPVATVWTGPDAPREHDALATADRPDVAAWTASMDAASRLELHGRTVTQALLGEPVTPLEERAGWIRVVLPWQPSGQHPDGYPGWVRATHVGATAKPSERAAVVTTPAAECRTSDGPVALSYGTRLPVLEADAERTTVALPDGRDGSLPTSSVRNPEADPTGGWAASLLASARQFVGLRYLWGGTCGWGLDCSGFVHLAHRVLGREVPRDSGDQMAASRPVGLDSARPGDHYFFARPGEPPYHVGFVTEPQAPGRPAMLHAPEHTELIEEITLSADRLETLVAAGSYAPEAS